MSAVELLIAWEYPGPAMLAGIVIAIGLALALLVPYLMKEIRKGKVSLGPNIPDGTGDTLSRPPRRSGARSSGSAGRSVRSGRQPLAQGFHRIDSAGAARGHVRGRRRQRCQDNRESCVRHGIVA